MESKMSRRQAWKAFRMGIIASGRRFPLDGQEAQDYWRLMRERFNEWFLSYLHDKADKIAKASGADRTDPFHAYPVVTPNII